jgi:shikimate kinase
MGKMIVLMGPKHAGKTTTGVALAELLGFRFIDLDERIEVQTGNSPRSLYREGAEVFRDAEVAALETLTRECSIIGHGVVIASGGGIVDNDRALELLQGPEAPVLVYLEVSPETAWNRVIRNSSGELPPFLNTDNPQETHRRLHERRAGAYKALAHLSVSGESKTPEALSREIRDCLMGWRL